jgi:CHAT domain-containing protein
MEPQPGTPDGGVTFARDFATPFRWLRIAAATTIMCQRCARRTRVVVPVFVDWFDRVAAEEQRSAADGSSCDRCGSVMPPALPLLQYRRGDVPGLVVAFPLNTPTEDDSKLIQDVIAIAGVEETEGANVVVAVRMHWWGNIWKRPLGPALLGATPLVLPEPDEEVQRWRLDTVRALELPDARTALETFVSRDDYEKARAFLSENDYLLSPRWRLTVDMLADSIKRAQRGPGAVHLVDQRFGRLRQIRFVGVQHAEDEMLTGPVAQLADRVANERDPRARAQLLRALVAQLDESEPDAITAAALTTLVASLHAHPNRGLVVGKELIATAERAAAVARTVFGDSHAITASALINLAIVTEERTDIPRGEALTRATELLQELAPLAARTGGREVADIATNLAAVQRSLTADETEEVTRFLLDAAHIRSLVETDDRRSTVVDLIDHAAALRSRKTGSRHVNARDAVAAIERARQLESEWHVLSSAEAVLVENNMANALHQLHAYDPVAASTKRLLDAVRTACASANSMIDRLHPVAIDILANAGGIVSELYSESVLTEQPDEALWAESVAYLEDALRRSREIFFEHHEVTLRILVNLAAAYGRPVNGSIAHSARCEALFKEVIHHAPIDQPRFTVAAATNLGQLRMGQGHWVEAADAYGIAAEAHDREILRARTHLTKIAEITGARDLAARRALALSNAGRWEDAVAVLEDARGRLIRADASASVDHVEQRAVATVHVACCDYGTLAVVRVPDGTLFGFHSALVSREVDRLVSGLLEAPDRSSRHHAFDALGELLSPEVVDPIATIVTNSIVPVDEVHVVACGAFAACPLHAISDLSGRDLTSRFVVRYRRTTSDPVTTLAHARDQVLALIAPASTLPFANAEVDALSRWSSSLAAAEEGWSRRAWLLGALPNATAVHIACHARSNRDDPMESAFEVDGEDVTVSDLAKVMTPRLELVVAPACQSATPSPYAPDELLGVAHALVHSGAKAIVASMWDADDEVTAFVVSVFYREMVTGREPVEALTAAQRYVASITGPELRELARERLAGFPECDWLPYDLAIELSALSAHPDLRAPGSRCFPHPADWATLSYLDG